jgi:hypothetical protein
LLSALIKLALIVTLGASAVAVLLAELILTLCPCSTIATLAYLVPLTKF